MTRPAEDELIARFLAPIAGPGALGLQDDAALLSPPPGHDLVLTVDAIVDGVHFLPDDPPGSVAAKALGVNLSDLAAKGADPAGFLLTLGLPETWSEAWLVEFCGGLAHAAADGRCPLLGGDTVRAHGPLFLSVTALGTVPSGHMVRRTTARPGDLLCVTGTVGDAVLGLALLLGEEAPWRARLSQPDREFLVDRYRHPYPRNALAEALRDLASSAMDVSDGLAGDAAKLLRASGVTGTLDLDGVPLSHAATVALSVGGPALRDRLVSGGDDYEVLFTLPPERWDAVRVRAEAAGVPVTIVGAVEPGTEPLRVVSGGAAHVLSRTSYQHFGDVDPRPSGFGARPI